MKMRKYFSPSLLLTVAFVLSVFLLFFIAGISFKQIKTLSETQQSITHSLDVRVDLERLFSELKDAESAHRGYLITNDERYLQPYNYSHVTINKSLLDIQALTRNDSARKREFDTLSVLINQRFNDFRDNIIQKKRLRLNSAAFQQQMWEGKGIMDSIRAQINEIIASEDEILSRQQRAHENEITFTPFTSSFLVIFSIIIFLLTFLTLKRNLTQMKDLNHRLLLVNETFNYAEDIGEICHWQFDVKTGRITFSDNRFKMLGSPSFEPTVKSFMKFVHPHDRKKVQDCFVKAKNMQPQTIFYRIRRADRKVRYLKTISKLTRDSEGSEMIIGIDCDVTAQQRGTLKLEEKNKELLRSNSELSSFNHIVSHDLQEPLRKIQMFISRIDQKDMNVISGDSQSYFSRIRYSANRAQKLIDDLLVYSRLDKSKKPEITNLNQLLDNAKTDMAQAIEDKKAEIISDKLPSVKIIPYQIQQLFVNLISNSIKYSKDGVAPKIEITYKLVDAKNTTQLKKQVGKKYHKLTFTDNGIGFEPEYESRIFVLFHRLHDKEIYSGTGIGLAICKKMAENHDGFIFATGMPGIGAVFTLYLPA